MIICWNTTSNIVNSNILWLNAFNKIPVDHVCGEQISAIDWKKTVIQYLDCHTIGSAVI